MSETTIQLIVIFGIVSVLAVSGTVAWVYERKTRQENPVQTTTPYTLTFEAQSPHWIQTSQGQYLRLTDGSTITYKEG